MIIAICGFQGAGKDTLAEVLIKKYDFIKLSFAGIVKDVASVVFGWERKMLEGDTITSRLWREQVDEWWAKRLNMPHLTPRFILQYFGTDLFRNHFHQDIWIACIEKKISQFKNVVITDCRFQNEISTIKNIGGHLIHIHRGELPEWFYEAKLGIREIPKDIHPSETSWILNDFEYSIENNSTLEELHNQIKVIIDKLI